MMKNWNRISDQTAGSGVHRIVRAAAGTLPRCAARLLAVSATAALLIAGTAYADGVILAPGVVLQGQDTEAKPGPGAGTGDGTAVITSEEQGPVGTAAQDGDSGSAGISGSDSAAAGTDGATGADASVSGSDAAGPGGDTDSQAAGNGGAEEVAVIDTAALIAQSLQDQYTVFHTEDPNLVISRGRIIDITKPLLALTYDDGPQTDAGNRIISAFDQAGQRATFFMVGDRVPSRASEVQRMAAGGHEVANHTYSHVYLNKVGAAEIRSQVAKCNDIIEQTCGIRPRIMRLPGGNQNDTVRANVGMPMILWNIDTRDWKHRNADMTVDAVLGKVKDGDVVLMHELYSATADATDRIVPQLVEQGFQLVTVSEMAALKGITLENRVYYSF